MLNQLNNSTKVLEKALDATWLRNEAITQNIANVDTPNYKRKTVKFEEYLSDALDKDRKNSAAVQTNQNVAGSEVDKINPVITTDNSSLSTRLDGNNVDIESEMASLAKNALQYNTLIQSMSKKFSMLKYVIREGR